MKVIKRDGTKVDFDAGKIRAAVKAAYDSCEAKTGGDFDETLDKVVSDIVGQGKDPISVEEIQDIVEKSLMEHGPEDVAKAYIVYRYQHAVKRQKKNDSEIVSMIDGSSEYWNTENSNKNSKLVTTQRDYMAGIVSKDIARNYIFPEDVMEAHDAGIIHIHDLDYAVQHIHNCDLINLNDMLQNGTMINGVKIDKPHRILTAVTIATQVIAAVASSSFGGCTVSLTHLAPFVRSSYDGYVQKYLKWGFDKTSADRMAVLDTKKEVSDAVQTLNYQTNSLSSTNGQAPFVSIEMYLNETQEYKEELALLIEEVLNQRILGMKNRVGVYVTQAFPKLLYVLEEDNIRPGTKYWYLTELAAKCTAKRMVPDYISEKKMKEYKLSLGETKGNGDCYPCMGCRSFLTPDRSGNGYNNVAKALDYEPDKPKYYGRFNIGVVTLNLVDVALSSGGKFDEFWNLMDERTELCHTVQKIRAERLSKTKGEVAPILWCDGALARLDPQETLEPLIHGGYATSSLGFAGLYECVKFMTGESHTQPVGHEFSIKVMRFLNDKAQEWKNAEDIDYSIYSTPLETTTYTFAKGLKKRFGEVKGITDRNYITNSYHIPVFEEINAFDKLTKEAEYQVLSPGGMISYIETVNLQDNIPAVIEVMQHIYDNTLYAELNCKSDYCQECGYDGEIVIKVDPKTKKHYFECPNCGNTNQDTMNIARRCCGYISSFGFNEGRLQEIAERVVHLDDKEEKEF